MKMGREGEGKRGKGKERGKEGKGRRGERFAGSTSNCFQRTCE